MADYTARPPMARSKGKEKGAFAKFLMSIFPVKGDPVMEMVRKVIFIIAVIAFVITGYILLSDIFGEFRQMYTVTGQIEKEKDPNYIKLLPNATVEQIKSEKPYIRESLMGLYASNNDLVGYFNLGGADKIIDYPVVQAEDNDKYLTTDFYGEKVKSGAIFVDYRAEFSDKGEAPNFMVLYGHNTSSSLMFSKLTRYFYDKDNPDSSEAMTSYIKKHPTIRFDTLAEEGTYKVFAVCLFNTDEQYGEVYNYLRYSAPFKDKDDFNNYILDIMDRSVLLTDVDLTYGDEIICLSTCYFPFGMEYDNIRCGIFARKVREGESPEVDTSVVQRTYGWKSWQQAIDRGYATASPWCDWDTSKLLSL